MTLDEFTAIVAGCSCRLTKLLGDSPSPPESMLVRQTLVELAAAVEELRVAEEELRAQNEELVVARDLAEREKVRYQALFDLAPDAYIVTDLAGTIRQANLAAARVFEVERAHLIGKPMAVFIPSVRRQRFRDQLDRVASGLEDREWVLTIMPRDRTGTVSLRVHALASTDRADGPVLRWILRDVSPEERALALAAENDRLRAELAHAQDTQGE